MTSPALASCLPIDTAASAAQRTRNRLLRAGIACFAELGYQTASTRMIEGAAGVNRNLITHHWGSKDEFWKACIDCLAGAFGRELVLADDQAANIDDVEQLRFFIRAFVRASAKFPEMHRVMLDEGKREEDRLRWVVERHVQPLKARLEQLLEKARRLNAAPNVDLPSFYYMVVGAAGMFAMAAESQLLFGQNPFEDAAVAKHADAIARLLIPERSSALGEPA